jgi:hypothetical protein
VRRHLVGSADRVDDRLRPSKRGTLQAVAVLAALLMIAVVGVSTAQATPSYRAEGSIGRGEVEELSSGSIAVDDSTGDVLVANGPAGKVLVYEGGPTGQRIGEIGGGELNYPTDIAVDESNGDVYVSDPFAGGITRYLRTSTSPPTYARDNTYTSPEPGIEPGQVGNFQSTMAVDPTTGDLLVADIGNLRVSRFAPTGSFISSFNGSGSPAGAFHLPLDLAVGPDGAIYVVDLTQENTTTGGESVLEKFTSAGISTGELAPIKTPRVVAVDPSSGDVLVAGSTYYVASEHLRPRLSVFRDGALVNSIAPPELEGATAAALAIDGGSSGDLYVRTGATPAGGFTGVEVFSPILLPTLTIDPPSAVTSTGAHLSGSVDPEGLETHYRFEYSKDGGISWKAGPEEDAGEGQSPEPPVTVSADPILDPNTTYLARLAGTNINGEITTEPVTLHTATASPVLGPVSTSGLSETEVTLNGSVTPFGLPASYHFEFGLTTAYGSRTPMTNGQIGKGYSSVPVSNLLSGLAPGTTYHYRLIAENSIGISQGEDHTFTTLAEVPRRGIELVSPAEKEGAPFPNPLYEVGFQTDNSGDAIVYTTKAALPQAQSSPLQSRAEAIRGPGGWLNRPIDPPLLGAVAIQNTLWSTLAVSEDLSHSLVVSMVKLTPEAIEGQTNLYVKDLATGAYEFVGSTPDVNGRSMFNAGGQSFFMGGTPDFSSVSFTTNSFSFTPDTPEAGGQYLWTRGEGLRLISRLPDGTPCSSVETSNATTAKHEVSVDGRHTFLSCTGVGEGLYVYESGTTKPISVSEISGASGEPVPATFLGATPDGGQVMFVVAGSEPLVLGAPEATGNVYVANLATGTLRYVTEGDSETSGVSEELDYLYYKKAGPASDNELWVAHDGTSKMIASIANGRNYEEVAASPNGEYFAFSTSESLLGSRTSGPGCAASGCSEVYVYAAGPGTLVCASCSPNGEAPMGNATMARGGGAVMSRHAPNAVTDRGQVYFDTPDSLVAPDVNGLRDVYEFDARSNDVTLITDGTQNKNSAFAEASPDGSNVFFVTASRLVPGDVDSSSDLYDARIGGGFGEAQKGVLAGCDNDECTTHAESPVPVTTASEQLAGAGKVKAKRHKPKKRSRCSKPHGKKGKKKVKACKKRHDSRKSGKRSR